MGEVNTASPIFYVQGGENKMGEILLAILNCAITIDRVLKEEEKNGGR